MIRARQPSSTTIASSVSGAATPEVPYRFPPSTSLGASPSPRFFPGARNYEDRRYHPEFLLSDRSSFFNQLPPTLEDNDDEEDVRASFGEEDGGGGHRYGFPLTEPLYPPLPPPLASLSPVEALWQRQRSLVERSSLAAAATAASATAAAAETDEDMGGREDEVRKRFHSRRTSLPSHPLSRGLGGGGGVGVGPPGGTWDFKSVPFSNIPVGRVSPLTSDNEHGGAVVKKKLLAAQKDCVESEALVQRTLSESPPFKNAGTESAGMEGGSRAQSPQKPDTSHHLSPELGKQVDEEEEEEEDEEEEEEEEKCESESESEEGGEERVQWKIGDDVDDENGAKAVHSESFKRRHHPHPPPPPPPTTLPTFQKRTHPTTIPTSVSTPNSLTRPKHAAAPQTAPRLRTPSVPALPTSLLLSPGPGDSVQGDIGGGGGGGVVGRLGEYERTLHNARNYMREFRALAESGSSDQESDPEPSLTTQLQAAQVVMEEISTAAKLPALINHHMVTLRKEEEEEEEESAQQTTDLGFSLSDGLGEPGVYIKSIHSGGLAEKSGLLQPFDRIMKVRQ